MALTNYHKYYAAELDVTVADTEVNEVFGEVVDVIAVRPKIDVWVHPSDTSEAGDGESLGKRIFVGQNERRLLP